MNCRLKLIILLALALPAFGGVEYKKFADPKREQAYQLLINELRCLVCQNQTIASSNAALAKDLRRQVYEMLQQGKSRQQIVDFMLQRYGDFVLYNPPFKAKTSVLYLAPIAFLALGFLLWRFLGGKRRDSATLDASQQAKIQRLLDEEEL